MRTAADFLKVNTLSLEHHRKLLDEAEALTKEIGELQRRMDAAIAVNDANGKAEFNECDAKQRRLKARLDYVKNALTVPRPWTTRAEVVAAWRQHAHDVSAVVRPLVQQYEEHRKQLAEEYKTIIALLGDAYKVRDRLDCILDAIRREDRFNVLGGVDPSLCDVDSVSRTYDTIYKGQAYDIDVAYFAAHGDIDPNDVGAYDCIVRGHGANRKI